MKKLNQLIILICLILFFSCKKENSTDINGQLSGVVSISATWSGDQGPCFARYECTIGLGYSSTDIGNEAYFARGDLQTGNKVYNYSKKDLSPGTYYYRVKVVYVKRSNCDSDSEYFNPKIKSGAFDIIGGETTTIRVHL